MLLPLLLKVAAQSPPLTDYLWLNKSHEFKEKGCDSDRRSS